MTHRPQDGDLAARDLEGLRERLIELSRRSRLIHLPTGTRAGTIRFVATPLRATVDQLYKGKELPLIPLPEDAGAVPEEELTPEFVHLFEEAKAADAEYQTALASQTETEGDRAPQLAKIEHRIRNQVREKLGWPPRPERAEANPQEIARRHGIDPSYDLPLEGPPEAQALRYLQTLLLPKDLEAKADALRRRARTALEERGIEILKLAIGVLEWFEHPESDRSTVSPLLLLPVQLDRRVKARTRTPEFVLKAEAEAPERNEALALRLQKDFGIVLPDLETETENGTGWPAIARFLAAVADVAVAQRGWRVRPWLTLAPLSFAKIAMWRDLDPSLWPDSAPASHPLVYPLLRAPKERGESIFAAEIDVERTENARLTPHLVLDADSSQHAAIIDAMKGRSFVIHGPPGTGKSQTIVNLIVNAIAAGKRVLFVSEKRAALEVVFNRLLGLGLGDFALQLHGAEATPQAVIAHLKKRRNLRPENERLAPSADDDRTLLKRHVETMNAPIGPRGETAFDLIGELLLNDPDDEERRRVLRQLSEAMPAHITREDLGHCERLVTAIEDDADALARAGLAEPHVSPFAGLARHDLLSDEAEDLLDGLERLAEAAETVGETARVFGETLHAGTMPPTPSALRDLARRVATLGVPPESLVAMPPGALALPADARRAGDIVRLADEARRATETLRNFGIDRIVDPASLEALEADVATAGLPPTLRLSDVRTACQHAEARAALIRDLAQQAWRIADLLGFSPSLRLEEVETLVSAAESAAALGARAIAERRPGLEADAKPLAEAARRGTALAQTARPMEGRIACDGLAAEHAEAMRSAAATFGRWGLFTAWTAAGKDARAALGRYWLGPPPVPKPQEAAALLDQAAEAITGTVELLRDPAVRRWRTNAQRLADLALDSLAEAARWQAGLHDRRREAPLGHLIDRLVGLPVEPFRDLAESREPLGTLRDTLAAEASHVRTVDGLCSLAEARAAAARRLVERVDTLALPSTLGIAEVASLREACSKITAAKATAEEPLWRVLFGDTPDVSGRALAGAAAAVRYALELHTKVPEAAALLAEDVARNWPRLDAARVDLAEALDRFDGAKAALDSLGAAPILPDASNKPVEETIACCKRLVEGKALLAPTIQWLGRLAEAESLPAPASLARALRTGRLRPKDLLRAFRWSAARACLRAHGDTHRDVFRQGGDALDRARDRFRRADRRILEAAAQTVQRRLCEFRPPRGSAIGRKRDWTEMALIEHEMTKSRGFVRLRRLMDHAFAAVTTLTPCVMMSPLAVAELLPARYDLFDLLVIDEASQVKPEDALGTLLRAKQAVIVGDPKQLPPTRFFDRLIDDGADPEEEGDDPIAAESVLDLAEHAFAPSRRLLWHYRSRHESLIAFSNGRFYDDSLIVFPAPAQPGEALGVELREVGGVWRGGAGNRVNVEEVRAVVEEISALAQRGPDRSIGVVTMNQAQMELIERELEQRARADSVLADYQRQWEERADPREPLFIKNLENVQGDERDVILVSLGYGRTPEGVLHQRFMPIQRRADGHRRLNVLFTRARSKLIVFASIKPEEILADGRSDGVQVLRDYLTYARDGRLEIGIGEGEPESPFEESVQGVLVGHGYNVACQVGVAGYRIDLAVRHPRDHARFVIGIECDGATYHSAKSARDRDRLRQEALERLGWRITRVWSTDWYRDPAAASRRLIEAIDQAIAEATPPPAHDRAAAADAIAVVPSSPPRTDHVVRAPRAAPDRPVKPAGPASLVEALIDFRENRILAGMPEADRARGILRRQMLREIVRTHLDDPDDFHRKIPQALRVATEGAQVKRYLDDICEIVARYPPGQPLPD